MKFIKRLVWFNSWFILSFIFTKLALILFPFLYFDEFLLFLYHFCVLWLKLSTRVSQIHVWPPRSCVVHSILILKIIFSVCLALFVNSVQLRGFPNHFLFLHVSVLKEVFSPPYFSSPALNSVKNLWLAFIFF